MEKYVKLDEVLDCACDFFLCGEEDTANYKAYLEENCTIKEIDEQKSGN